MLTDALSDLIRDVGDDSSPEHKAIFHLWSALDDIAAKNEYFPAGRTAREAMQRAAAALTREETP